MRGLMVVAALLGALVAGVVLAACGDDAGDTGPSHATPTPSVTATSTIPYPTASPEQRKEVRVAFINLLSPVGIDNNNTEASQTFDARLEMVVRQMRQFDPDIVGFNEATVTREHGSVVSRLAKELKMEFAYVRANPQFPGLTTAEGDDLALKTGFQEGELILVRGDRWPLLKSDSYVLNPRTSEAGEARVGLHVVLKGPESVGNIDVYITHLTGGGNRVRAAQAADFKAWVTLTRGRGPTILMIGQSDPTSGDIYTMFQGSGYTDVGGDTGITTCCRDSVVGMQPTPAARTDLLMWARWQPSDWALFLDRPEKQTDGTWIYASDHNGLRAVFTVPQPQPPPPDPAAVAGAGG